MTCLCQVRETPIRQLTLLASDDAEAGRHAGLLSRRTSVHAVSIQRWAEWRRGETEDLVLTEMQVLRAEQLARAADAIVDSLPAALHSLVVGEFALTCTTFSRLGRYAAMLRHYSAGR